MTTASGKLFARSTSRRSAWFDVSKTALSYLQPDKRSYVDETPKPKWALAPDGRHTDISGDERFDSLWQDWASDACQHERRGIVRWVNSGNQTCYNWFCSHCGTKLSPNIPHELAQRHGAFDVALDALASRTNAYVRERESRLDELKAAAAERAQPGNREEYSDYLRSPKWQALRSKILARARGTCEGCLEAPAEDVHHLSYDHKGGEFAFELVALCRGCHERWHQEAAE